jgi:hypothetical protein
MSRAEAIWERFCYRPPTADRSVLHQEARSLVIDLALALADRVPEGREWALVLTHLEEALYWANAGIARNN